MDIPTVKAMYNLFCSYSHQDSAISGALAKHLQTLEPDLLHVWFDEELRPSENWVQKISDSLDGADFVVLLLSVDYFASSYCRLEMKRALELDAQRKTNVILIMLRPCNLPADLRHLQVIFADHPLATWPNEDAACKKVTEEVEDFVREQSGLEAKNKLAHPNRKELTRLLDYLCDRNPQYVDLVERAQPAMIDPRRPFIIVTQGVVEDAHDRFLDRLEYRLLPEFLSVEAKRLSPLIWPGFRARRTAEDLFGPQFAPCLKAKPWATTGELNDALKRCSPVSLVPTTVAAENWGEKGHKLLELYFQFWKEWPNLPEERFLIPVLSVKYGPNEEINLAMRQSLLKTDLARGRLGGLVMRPFSEIRRQDMEEWIGHDEVRPLFASAPVAIERLSLVFPEDGVAWRMHPLAQLHFPRYLSNL
jgi:hypothetical protein